MSEKVQINSDDNFLQIIVSGESQFLSGLHRVFFTNIMGLKEFENGLGYYIEIPKINLSDTIIELTDYFKDENAEILFDKQSESFVDTFDEGKNDFEKASIAGKQIKDNPPIEIDIPDFKRELKKYQLGQ